LGAFAAGVGASAVTDQDYVSSSNDDDDRDEDPDMQSMRASVQAAQVAADEAEAALRRSFGALAKGVVGVGAKGHRRAAAYASPPGRTKLERAAALVEDMEEMYNEGETFEGGDQDSSPLKSWRVRDRMLWKEAAGAAAAGGVCGRSIGRDAGVGRYDDAANQGKWQQYVQQRQQHTCTSDLISNLASRYSEAQSFLKSFKDSVS
jgi:hypothetical protein